ncbi:MAG: recombination protein RecR [Candidatus Nomurabacteria bacterium]|nr:MAG: recombination protein RecR [Candidatus Nomurabacteria bacterium]
MTQFPAPIHDLIEDFARLPGVGRKTAERYVLYLLTRPPEQIEHLVDSLRVLKEQVRSCEICGTYTESSPCRICRDTQRDLHTLCVVATSADMLAIESTGEYQGRYHVLGGVLNPIDGIGPEQLRVTQLLDRVQKESIEELIIATNPDMEGEATGLYLHQQLKPLHVKVTRLARGLPMGSDLEYTDEVTLSNAIKGRSAMQADQTQNS